MGTSFKPCLHTRDGAILEQRESETGVVKRGGSKGLVL